MTYLLLAIGIGACATPGRQSDEPLVTKPATWTHALMDARKIDPDWVLMQYNTCHPEPAPHPNTTLLVWEFANPRRSFHRDILKRWYWHAATDLRLERMDGIRRSDVAGLDALTLEINSRDKSPHDRGLVYYNSRYWSIPFSKRVFLVVAYRPLVPDPDCSLELEKTINEILLLLAAEQAIEAKARPAVRARP